MLAAVASPSAGAVATGRRSCCGSSSIEASGPTIWNNLWFAGHHTPGVRRALPVARCTGRTAAVAIASCVLAAWCFHDLARGRPRALAASLLFAAGTVVNVAIGRLTFALGLAVAVAALAAARRGKTVLATVLAVATAPASPVAAVALGPRPRRRGGCTTAAPAGGARGAGRGARRLAAVLFPQGGEFPFRGGALAWSLAAAAIVGLVTTAPVVRSGALLYAAAASPPSSSPTRSVPISPVSGCSPPHR